MGQWPVLNPAKSQANGQRRIRTGHWPILPAVRHRLPPSRSPPMTARLFAFSVCLLGFLFAGASAFAIRDGVAYIYSGALLRRIAF